MEREQSELNHTEITDFSEHITLSREEVIDEIINKDLGYYGSIEWLEKILKDGFAGYKKLSNEELTEEFVNYFPDHILTITEELEGGNKMTNNICTLKFYISDTNILDMVVDVDKKFAKVTHISHEKSASPIIPQKDRHYAGLERRLQIYMQSKKPLPDLIKEIELNGIHVDFHTNLNIDVVY